MTKVKYDVSGATPGGDWEHVQPGLYQMKIEKIEAKRSKKKPDGSGNNPMLEIQLRPIADADGEKLQGEFNSVWHYILVDGSQDGRLRAFTDAIGAPPKGSLDTDEHEGDVIMANLKSDKDQDGEYRPRVAKVMPLAEGVEVPEEEEEEGEEEGEEEIDLSTLDRTQLKALIKEHSLDIKVLKSMTDDQLREAIAEAFGGEDEEEEEEDEEEEDESVDLASLDRTQLKALIKENELEVRVLKSDSDDDLRAKIAEAMGGESEEEEEASDNGYASMGVQDLKNALKERGLSTSGAKKVLVGRLEEDDKKGGDPF
jgi:SAP domain